MDSRVFGEVRYFSIHLYPITNSGDWLLPFYHFRNLRATVLEEFMLQSRD